jgi:hypothetical protein
MQQTMVTELEVPQAQGRGYVVSVEWVAYAALLLVALAFRLMSLGDVPISVGEAPDALAAWRTLSPEVEAFPEEAVTDSPSLFWAQKVGFTLFGDSEFASRLLTALAGTALVFTPLLFRADLGRTRTFILCLLLAFSPVALLASRFSAGAVWSMLFAMIGTASFRRYWATSHASHGVGAITAFAALLFLSEPGGIVLALLLLGAAVIAVILNTVETIDETPNPAPFAEVRQRVAAMPLLSGLALAAGLIVAVTTGFLTYQPGLSGVGELVGNFFTGWTQRPEDAPRFLPLLVSLFYEPILWVFAAIGLALLLRGRAFTLLDRFFLAWTGLALIAALLYAGAEPAHALWLTLPLAGLASYVLANCFMEEASLWGERIREEDTLGLANLRWARLLLIVVTLGLLAMLAMHLQVIGRNALQVEGGALNALLARAGESNSNLRVSLLWTFITIMFLIVGGLLSASVWGNTTTLQGMALGLLVFMLINGLSSTWNAGVAGAHQPVEPWHTRASAQDVPLLRETLIELAQRETMGYLDIPVTVVENPATGLTRDGVVAWVLRDFRRTTFVSDVNAARTAEIVVMQQQSDDPDLGGSYVGQPFTIVNQWDVTSQRGFDFISWWFQRQVRVQPVPAQEIVLWVRMDIYESVPFTQTSQLLYIEP